MSGVCVFIYTMALVFTLLINFASVAFNLKLYTEIMKEKSQRQR